MEQHYPKHKKDFTTRFKTTKLCQIQALMCVPSCFSHVQLFGTPWTVARQTSLSMGFSRQEYWSGLPFPPPGDLPDPGIEPRCPALKVESTTEPLGKPHKL